MKLPAPNPHVSDLHPYEPGRPITDVAREHGLQPAQIAKLASNENPLGPSPRALQAIRDSLEHTHLYPDGAGIALREAIAHAHGLTPDHVVLGCGSNEIIEFCYHAYTEFTVSQKMEFFLSCHENAFIAFGGVPTRIMVDNLKSAVLARMVGSAPVFNPKYLDFSRHWGFKISPCNVRSGNEKGRVENGVGYVKKNFLAGLELPDFYALQPAATVWTDTVANVRVHGATHQRPMDLFETERSHLGTLNPAGFDLASVTTVRANKQFRIELDSNHYSVPARYAGHSLTLKAYADRVCLYEGQQIVARHVRSMDRNKDIEDPQHARELVAQRKSAREQRLLVQFLAISPRAQAYREGLEAKRVDSRAHLRKILAMVEMHGKEDVARALDDGLELQAFSAEYIANILGARRRIGEEPAALQLTRRADLLDLELPEPDLSIYDRDEGAD